MCGLTAGASDKGRIRLGLGRGGDVTSFVPDRSTPGQDRNA
jgi:hypothetical protein